MSKLKIPVNDRDHVRGAPDASLVLVEYGDYQCPYCAAAEPRVQRLEDTLSKDLRRVFRHFPLTQVHEYAFAAAISAEAAGLQGRFWDMHERLFAAQPLLGPDTFEALAEDLNLDLDEFRKAVSDKSLATRVKNDFMGGVHSGVNGTPSFFLNGEKYDGPLDADALIQLVGAA